MRMSDNRQHSVSSALGKYTLHRAEKFSVAHVLLKHIFVSIGIYMQRLITWCWPNRCLPRLSLLHIYMRIGNNRIQLVEWNNRTRLYLFTTHSLEQLQRSISCAAMCWEISPVETTSCVYWRYISQPCTIYAHAAWMNLPRDFRSRAYCWNTFLYVANRDSDDGGQFNRRIS